MELTTLWSDERMDIRGHWEYDIQNWSDAYDRGYREPRFPMPATMTLPVTLIDVYLVEHCIQLMAEFFNESSVYG